MIAAAKVALVLAGSLVVGAGVGAGVGAIANVVRPAAVQDDGRETDVLADDPAGSASAEPEAEAPDPNDPNGWVIDFGSVGPLRVGDSFAQAHDVLAGFEDRTDYALEFCPVLVGSFGAPSTYLVFPEWEGAIDLIDILRPENAIGVGPRTAEGIGFGSSLADVQAAYPSVEFVGEGYDGDPYYGIDNGSSRIVFSVNAVVGVDRVVLTAYDGVPEEYCG